MLFFSGLQYCAYSWSDEGYGKCLQCNNHIKLPGSHVEVDSKETEKSKEMFCNPRYNML